MAFADLHGSAVSKTEGFFDVTHRRFEQVVFDLLPRGAAWDREDPVLRAAVAAEATELSRADIRARKLRRELDPNTTFELITDWEEMLGLPDCAMPETIEARRAAILAKLLAQTGHDQGIGYWTELLEALGYELEWIEPGHPGMTCEDDCLDVLWEDEWLYVWSINVETGIDDELLECVVKHQALIETLPIVHVLFAFVDIPPNAGEIHGLATTLDGFMVAVGRNGVVYAASSDLETWTLVAPPTTDHFYCVCFGGTDGERLIAAGTAGVVFFSDDGGATWTAAADATAIDNDAAGISRGHGADQVVVVVGGDGMIRRSTDAGDNWVTTTWAGGDRINAVTCCTGALVAVGFDGQIIRSTDHGVTWAYVVNSILPELFGVAGWGTTVIAVGASGVIRRSDDAGASWADVESPTTTNLRAVTGSVSGRWTACGDVGTIVQSLDDGLTWEVREIEAGDDFFAAAASYPLGRSVVAGDNLAARVE